MHSLEHIGTLRAASFFCINHQAFLIFSPQIFMDFLHFSMDFLFKALQQDEALVAAWLPNHGMGTATAPTAVTAGDSGDWPFCFGSKQSWGPKISDFEIL